MMLLEQTWRQWNDDCSKQFVIAWVCDSLFPHPIISYLLALCKLFIFWSLWFRSTPHPGCQSPPGLWTIFRLGNPNLNLHLPLESWVGGRSNLWCMYGVSLTKLHSSRQAIHHRPKAASDCAVEGRKWYVKFNIDAKTKWVFPKIMVPPNHPF